MIELNEIRVCLRASWKLFRGDPDAVHEFDNSITGFWRSFFVNLLIAPAMVIIAIAQLALFRTYPELAGPTVSETGFFWAAGFEFAANALLVPIILALLAQPMGIGKFYIRYIVAWNWSSAIIICPYFLMSLLIIAGVGTASLLIMISIIILTLALYFRYRIARFALEAPVHLAIGITISEFLLSLLISRGLETLYLSAA